MPPKGTGGDFGEIILKNSQNYKIVDVKYTGKQGRNVTSYYPQIELVVEVG